MIFSGKSRLAKSVLLDTLRAHSVLPLGDSAFTDHPAENLVKGALAAAATLRDPQLDDECRYSELASRLNDYWALKKQMAGPSSNPDGVVRLMEALRPICAGLSLCGAGGGGFIVALLKRGIEEASLRSCIQTFLNQECSTRTAPLSDIFVSGVVVDDVGISAHEVPAPSRL